MIFKPHKYQEIAIQHLLNNDKAGLFLQMGLGKTISTLEAISELMHNRFEISKVLVIAPLRVAQTTWPEEIKKWDSTKHLSYSQILGSKKQREEGLIKQADIYIINRENVTWLVEHLGKKWDFDMVVIDELSSFKAPRSKRFKSLKKVISKCKRVVGLTGTPTPNGLIDLWSQIFLLDQGARLGRTVTGYRDRFFLPDKRNQMVVFSYKLKVGAEEKIHSLIGDICLSMEAKDWLDLPERIDNLVEIELPPKIKKLYKEFEKKQILELESGDITALNAATVTNKLLQMSNGAMYLDEDKGYEDIHELKLDALSEIVELNEGKNILVFYSYRHDLERLKMRFKGSKMLETSLDITNWNKGKIPMVLAHPASAGHGLNLQSGGNIIVWFGLPWSLELYQQANARLHRQGQKESVIIHHLLCKGTVDNRVMSSLQGKRKVQDDLIQYLKGE